ncbi:hypothetical protein N0V84_000224 [Fusarium piperis]|uniref:Uncharacterized protein n=1 Tax=Fusarium piperis TaxID=1435070 RepID=A0A9W9BTR9_9HYPO|nr:hypothetical protein N0V84_000224 [Fusarium piperis]
MLTLETKVIQPTTGFVGVRPLLSIDGLSKAQRDKYDLVFSDKDKKHFEKWGYTVTTEGKSKDSKKGHSKKSPKKKPSKKKSKKKSKKRAPRQETNDIAVYLFQE